MIVAARRPSAPSIDLLAWPAVADARARLAAAEEARAVAHRRRRHAPAGEVENRLRAFRAATQEELTAAGALQAVLKEAVH